MMRKQFKQPYFVTAHAVQRFQEEVARIPAHRVLQVVQEALQNPGEPVEFERRDGQLCPIFREGVKRKITEVIRQCKVKQSG